MKKPKNAIKDASKAIDLNPDQPLAYRIRGRAHGLLGELVFFFVQPDSGLPQIA